MSNPNNFRDIYDLLNKLCINIVGKNHRDTLKNVTQYISTNHQALSQHLPFDDTTLTSKISHQLSMVSKSQNDVILFMNINEQLSTCMDLRHRNAILTFLLCMANSNDNAKQSKSNGHQLYSSNDISTSNIFSSLLHINNNGNVVTNTSAISSNNKIKSSMNMEKIYPTIAPKPSIISSSSSSSENLLKITQQINKQKIKTNLPTTDNTVNNDYLATRHKVPLSASSSSSSSAVPKSAITNIIEPNANNKFSSDLTEELVQDVIYAFTGIQGKYLKKDIISGGFKLDQKARKLNVIEAGMLLRLAELGYYHDLVQSFTDAKSGRGPLGLFGQGLVTALKNELTQYYGMVAILQEQLNRQRQLSLTTNNENNINSFDKITLLKILLWSAEPMHRLQWLTTISEACQEKKGGSLSSAIYNFQYNGDQTVKNLVNELLLAVCGPLQYMLCKWLLEGEINDPYLEFFIEILPEVGSDRLWNDKYRVREIMLPSFISKELANKILVTGKSINFLREVCEDKTPIKGREELRQCFENNVQSLFAPVPDTKLHIMIDNVYLNTSKKVLDIVMGTHKLLEHLQAMRKYLLLGQGDFIGLLMENLKPELDRPGKELYSYELSSILDVAIRSTNAQYDDPEILKNLNVRLMSNFEGDTGWDIFTLQYIVQGPLSTMLEPSMCKYQLLFKPLWRMKHFEFVLSSKIWKEQMSNAKYLRTMQKELNPITYRLQLYTSEMIHFIHQMQYYILFEVIECSWTEMLNKVQKANALDDILEAHNQFLKSVKIGAFFDDNELIYGRLEAVFNASLKLEIWQDRFYDICFKEFNARKKEQEIILKSVSKECYGITTEQRLKRDEELKIFEQSLCMYQKSLEKIGEDYEFEVRQFLLMLASNNDHNLQLFGTRLDFNEYYKKRDQRLDVPLTFEHMRMSNMFFQNKSNTMNCSRYN